MPATTETVDHHGHRPQLDAVELTRQSVPAGVRGLDPIYDSREHHVIEQIQHHRRAFAQLRSGPRTGQCF